MTCHQRSRRGTNGNSKHLVRDYSMGMHQADFSADKSTTHED